MNKLSLIILISTWPFLVLGQEPKVSKVKEHTRNGKATYYVLQSDPTVCHGRYYIVAWTGNEKLVDGTYVFGKREGNWSERYYGVGKKNGPRSYGQYKDDKKTSRWTYFSISGDTSQVYDYSTNELIFSIECNTAKEYNVKTENGNMWTKLDCPPIFKGGRDIFFTDLSQSISSYPQELKNRGIHTFEINTVVIITVTTTGEVSDVGFSKPIGYGYEEKITKWISENGNDWIAGKLSGQTIEAQIEFPLIYRFQF